MVILGNVFNALMITKPIKELLFGVKNIADKNFKQRINLPLRGELGELISSFNLMAEKLEHYEEQNIEELTSEKAKLETLVSTIADGAVLVDTEMRIILANITARNIFSWDHQDVIGESILHHLPAELTTKLTKPLYDFASQIGLHPCIEADSEEPDQDTESPPKDYVGGDEYRISLTKPTRRTVRVLLTQVLDREKENVRGLLLPFKILLGKLS